MRKDIQNITLPFPLKGLHEGSALAYQPEGTTGDAKNVWPWDSIAGRARGGQRPGTKKFYDGTINGSNAIQALHKFVQPLAYTAGGAQRGGIVVGINATDEVELLDPNDLSMIWASNNESSGGSSAIFDGNGAIYAEAGGVISVIKHSDGTQSTRYAPTSATPSYRMVEDSDGNLIIIGNARHVSVSKSGTVNWNVAAPTSNFAVSTSYHGAAYYASNDTIYASANRTMASGQPQYAYMKIAASDGTLAYGYEWTPNTDTSTGDLCRDLAIWNDKLFIVHDHDGGSNVAVFSLTDDTLLWRTNIGFRTQAIAFYNDRCIIGGFDNAAASYDMIEINPNQSTTDGSILTQATVEVARSTGTEHGGGISHMAIDNGGHIYCACTRGSSVTHTKTHIDALATTLATYDSGETANYSINIRTDGLASSISTRNTWLMAVSAGKIYSINGGILTDESSTADLRTTLGEIQVTDAFGKAYFVDGTSYIEFNPDASAGSKTNTWTPSAGALPVSGSTTARLIARWNGRVILSGVQGDPHNVFASATGDPGNWDYAPGTVTQTQAWALNAADLGEVGDVVTCLIPYDKDVLLLGCDSEIWMLQGDPMAGGSLDLVTDRVGMAWGNPWAKDPDGVVYFWSSDGSVRRMVPGRSPQSISEYRLKRTFSDVDLGNSIIRMAWDVRHNGLHVYIMDRLGTQATHYYWDKRTDSWWPMQFPAAQAPTAVAVYDGDKPTDRQIILGGDDSNLRIFSDSEKNDDGTAIDSYVDFGPIRMGGNMMDTRLIGLYATLATGTDGATYAVRDDESTEQADAASNTFSGTWTGAGRHTGVRERARGKSLIARISNNTVDETWAVEDVTASVHPGGRTRG